MTDAAAGRCSAWVVPQGLQDAGVVDAGGTMGRVVQVSVPADRLTQRGAEDDASGLLERRIELRSAAGTPIASWPARIKVQ
ncbi:MAG: hypothetical protein U1F11_01540 [Steroidobacteraceae bacterium]